MIKFLKILYLIIVLGFLTTAQASVPILNIVPNEPSITVPSNSSATATWTVTNNSRASISNITIPSIQPAAVSIENSANTCSTLAPNASCTFKTLIPGANEPSSFQVIPKVCGFNNSICSQPTTANRLQVTVTHAGNSAYAYFLTGNDTLLSMNASTLQLGTPLPGFNFNSNGGIAVSPDGTKVYFSDFSNGNLRIASGGTSPALLGTINIPGSNPKSVTITPDGKTVYVTDFVQNRVYVINVQNSANPTLIASIPGFAYPIGIVANPNGSKVYVTNLNNNTVSVIDTNSNTVVDTISVGSAPQGIVISPDGTKIYVGNLGSNTISVIDANSDTILTNINLNGERPFALAINPDGSKIYATLVTVNQNILVIDIKNNYSKSFINGFTSLVQGGIAVSPDGSKVFVLPEPVAKQQGNHKINGKKSIPGNVDIINVNSGNSISTVNLNTSVADTIGDFVG